MSAEAVAIHKGDARTLALLLLLRQRKRHGLRRVEVFEQAGYQAAEMTAWSLRDDPEGARVYADAWKLLHDREMRLLRV